MKDLNLHIAFAIKPEEDPAMVMPGVDFANADTMQAITSKLGNQIANFIQHADIVRLDQLTGREIQVLSITSQADFEWEDQQHVLFVALRLIYDAQPDTPVEVYAYVGTKESVEEIAVATQEFARQNQAISIPLSSSPLKPFNSDLLQ